MTTLPMRARMLSLLLALSAYRTQATESTDAPKPSVAEQARAFGKQVKQDARKVGTAVKEEATKVGHAARKQAKVLKTKVTAHTAKADDPKPQ